MTSKIQIDYIAPELLSPNPWNSNHIGPEMSARLEQSLREFGFIKPVVCRQMDDGTLQIIGGEHRARKAVEFGYESIPVVVLKNVSDSRAKALGLADNGRYGEDDAVKLAQIMSELDATLIATLPFDDKDLAGIFATSSIDFDKIGFDDDSDSMVPDVELPRASATHQVMRFKVPIGDCETVEKLIKHVIGSKGFSAESDSMIAAGMALVEIVNASRSLL